MLAWLRPIVSQSRTHVLACYGVKKPFRGNVDAKVKGDCKRSLLGYFFPEVASNNGFGKGSGVGLEMLQSTRN